MKLKEYFFIPIETTGNNFEGAESRGPACDKAERVLGEAGH
jgi:hypothetical protein